MKKLIFAAVCAFIGVASHADAMYWQLSGTTIQGVTDSQWSMAQIEVYEDGTPTGTYLHYLDDPNVDVMTKSESGAWFDVTGMSGSDPVYSFVLELVNDDLEVQAASNPVSYSTLASEGKIVSDSTFNSITPLNYSDYNMGSLAGTVDVPEPTSGLLMLLGASLLALRRRQA